nr:MAG TPA: hypothetical protein [Caudoviricetes sp.]
MHIKAEITANIAIEFFILLSSLFGLCGHDITIKILCKCHFEYFHSVIFVPRVLKSAEA